VCDYQLAHSPSFGSETPFTPRGLGMTVVRALLYARAR